MELKKEFIITSLLVLMIGISIFFSWNIISTNNKLTRQSSVESSTLAPSVAFKDKRKYNDLILPEVVIIHDSEENHYVARDEDFVTKSYNDIRNLSLQDFSQGHFEQAVSLQFLNKLGVEFIMIGATPLEIFSIDSNKTEDYNNFLFNRILYSWEEEKFYFYMSDQSNYISASFNIESYNKPAILNQTLELDDLFIPNKLLLLDNLSVIYVPKTEVIMDEKHFFISKFDMRDFEALFFGNSSVKIKNKQHSRTITDGKGLLTIFYEDFIFSYVKPSKITEDKSHLYFMIKRNIDFVNGHFGWDNYYRYRGLSEDNSYINFQFFIDNYPVFCYEENCGLKVNYSDKGLTFYKRPYFYFDFEIETENKHKLPPAENIIEQLRNTEWFEQKKMTNMKIGYTLLIDEKTDNVAVLVPKWHLYYDNSWIEFNELQSDSG